MKRPVEAEGRGLGLLEGDQPRLPPAIHLRPHHLHGEIGGAELPRGLGLLEGDQPRLQPAIHLRQHHLHGEIGGGEPAGKLGPGLAVGRGEHELQERRIRRLERRASRPARGKAGEGENRIGPGTGELGGEKGAAFRVLEPVDEIEPACDPPVGKGGGERLRWRGIAREVMGAIEDHRDLAPGRRGVPRRDQPGRGKALRGAHSGGRSEPAEMEEEVERARRILRPPCPSERGKRGEGVPVHRRKCGERFFHLRLGSDHGERQRMRAGEAGEFLEPVAPRLYPADQPHQHRPRGGEEVFEEEIDREGMTQCGEIGEPEPGPLLPAFAPRLPGSGEGGEITLGEGEDGDLGRFLPEITRGLESLQSAPLGEEEMHGVLRGRGPPRSPRGRGRAARSPRARSGAPLPPARGGRSNAESASPRPGRCRAAPCRGWRGTL